jgi:hypothetical protein
MSKCYFHWTKVYFNFYTNLVPNWEPKLQWNEKVSVLVFTLAWFCGFITSHKWLNERPKDLHNVLQGVQKRFTVRLLGPGSPTQFLVLNLVPKSLTDTFLKRATKWWLQWILLFDPIIVLSKLSIWQIYVPYLVGKIDSSAIVFCI